MPKDPSQLFINTSQDPGLIVGSDDTSAVSALRYPQDDTSSTNTIVNIIQYNLNTVGANNQVLINKNNVATGDAELTYDANTNVLTADTISVGNIHTAFLANLGNVSNVRITGGSANYVLKTDGAGNLSWVSQQVASTTWSSITGKPTFATVATSGNYNDLANIPTGMATTSYVNNLIANVTYANLSDSPVLATIATSGRYSDLANVPNLSAVATSGNYNDLANKPSIPSISGLATETYVTNQIANVTYANLSGTPTIPTHTSNIINDSNYTVSDQDLNTTNDVEFNKVTIADGVVFENNVITSATSLGGEVNIETASQAGDPNKTWSFNHDGAGSLYVPIGSSIKAEEGLSILATETEFVNFTNVRDFDTNSSLDFDYINIVNPEASILNSIDTTSANYAAGVGASVRFVYANYLVKEATVIEAFSSNPVDDPLTGLPRYTGRIDFNSTTNADLIKEISFGHSRNWRFAPNGNLILPAGGDIVDSTGNSVLGAGGSGNSISDGTSNVTVTSANGNVVIGVNNDAASWTFATNGIIYSKPDTDLRLIASDTTGNGNAVQQIVSSGISELAKTSLDEYKFSIYTDMQGAGAGDEWSFKGDTLEVITSSTIRAFDANIVTEAVNDGLGGTASLRSRSSAGGFSNIFSTFDATTTSANIKVYNGGSTGGTGYTWEFDNNGNLNVPFNGAIKAGNLKIYPAMSGFTTSMVQEFGNLDIRTSTGVMSVGWNAYVPGVTGNLTSAIVFGEPQNIGNVIIRTGNTDATTYNWVFGDDGNLTLPGNTFSVNYADGTQVSIGGGSGIALTDLSIGTDNSANGGGSIAYANTTGVFTYTPPDLSSYLTTITNIFDQDLNTANNVTFNSVITNNVHANDGGDAVTGRTAFGGSSLSISSGDGGDAVTSWNAGNGGNLTIKAGDAGSDIGSSTWGAVGGNLVLRGGNSSRPYHGSDVQIHSGDSVTSPGLISLHTGTNQWTFGKDGTTTLPNNATIIAPNTNDLTLRVIGQYNICTIQNAGSGYTGSIPLPTATTGGTGSGMTVNFGYGISGQLASVSVSNPGTGYNNGDVIGVVGGSGTFVLTNYNPAVNGVAPNNNTAPTDWIFDTDGNITLPTNYSSINYANGSPYGGGGAGGGLPLSNGNSIINIASVDGNITLDANGNIFTFGTDGSLTTPSNLVIGSSGLGTGTGFTQLNAPLLLGSSEANGGLSLVWYEDPAGPGNVVQVGLNSSTPGSMTVTTGDYANTTYVWNFDNVGNLTLPTDGNIYYANGNIYGGTNTGNITFTDTTMASTNGDVKIGFSPTSSPAVEFTFTDNGNLVLPQGTILSEAANSTTITPPNALAGQGLVVRLTGVQGIVSDHPGGFTDGDTITLTVTPDYGSAQVTGTLDYTFTGCTSVELGRALTGTLTFNNVSSMPISWTIPVSSTMTTFTVTISNASGFTITSVDNTLTLTTTGSTEDHHIHLIAGDPSITDIYLGDDDQYVKIEKNGGNVLIGTDTNTKQWMFGTDGNLTLPNNGSLVASTTNGSGYNITVTPEEIDFVWNGENTFNIAMGPAGGSINTELDKSFAVTIDDGSKQWTFNTDGSLSFPDTTLQTTAYRNRPLNNLNLDGGSASVVFEVDLTYIECGGSYLRGILSQDIYDGTDGGSTTTQFDNILDGGQA